MKTGIITFFLLLASSMPIDFANVEIIKFKKLDAMVKEQGNQIRVINFWATWCAPCIKEIPYFEKAANKYGNDVDVNLVSLDYADQIARVNKFVERKKITSQVFILDETDHNTWIDRLDKSWSGAIPATLLVNQSTGERTFIEGELKEGDLERQIEKLKTKK